MGSSWLLSEELQLCVSWVRQSTCNITGRYQNKNNLWKKVHDDYVKNWCVDPENPLAEPRTKVALESHFPRLKKLLKKWHTCLYKSRNRAASGTNLVDEETQAQSLYFKDVSKKFDKKECYEAVINHPYFLTVVSTPPFERNFPISPELHDTDGHVDLDDDEGFTTPASNQKRPRPSSPVRPMGVKAAKEAKKKGKKALMEANMRRDEETLRLARESLELENRKEARLARRDAMAELQEETKIMTMDTSIMTPKSVKWHKKRK
ncbi:PREDICTED: uncharacterized protein LOC101302450 [Fragaria vesca subsp. vesca]